MTDIFSGDPRLFLEADGSYLAFKGGQPVMDQGGGNAMLIALFTGPGWCGNEFALSTDEKIGSDFENVVSGTVTLKKLAVIKSAAERAALSVGFKSAVATVTNPSGSKIVVKLEVQDAVGTITTFTINKGFKGVMRNSVITYDGVMIGYGNEFLVYIE